ncbi:helix-turn-helix transcriptional regulator [Methylocystis suflitae]|uniref:helix-turn-helix transcriptional regulator n=1 Tax=Methylocystis suflitae TaxID=2951405 RepID=UPI00210E8DDD|nr:helix-turn-helix transcriptional regulator [Methylocystis suflitae]MCQ4188608.1 helix-turn-helix transcriptional regulator [Methylocystis suflitae]
MTDYESLVDQIYEAAANPDLWPQALRDLGGAVDAAGGIITTRRADAWTGWRCSGALEPGADAYWRKGSQANVRLLAFTPAGSGFVTEQDVLTDEEYLADPIMTDYCTPAGLHHAAATVIHVPNGDLVGVQVSRRIGEPQFDREDIARLDAFRPHLARAGFLAARWRLQRLRAATEALAMIGLPAAILDARGKALAANALIDALNAHIVWLPKDRIALVDPAADALLRRAVAEIADPAATSVRSFPSKGAAANPAIVHLIPATGEARDLFGGGFGLLIVTAVTASAAPDAALIQGLFDLTPAEARVARAFAQRKTIDGIAAEFGVSRETIRTQVKSVLAKTGCARQSDLAAILVRTTLIG